MTNLAYQRPATPSSTWSAGYEPGRANDGDGASGWSAAGNDRAAWWQVDLGQAQQIDRVTVLMRQDFDQPETRTGFKVRGSNTPDFSRYSVLTQVEPGTTIPHRGAFTGEVYDRGAYRYIRIAKTDGRYFFFSDVTIVGRP